MKGRLHEYKGAWVTVRDMETHPDNVHGLNQSTLRDRILRKNISIEEAISYPAQTHQTHYQYKGKLLTVRELVDHPDNVHKLSIHTIRSRVYRGLVDDEIFDNPRNRRLPPRQIDPIVQPTKNCFCVYRDVQIAGKRTQRIWWGGIRFSRDGYRAWVKDSDYQRILERYPDAQKMTSEK